MSGARSALAGAGERLKSIDDKQLRATFYMQTGIIDYLEGSYHAAVTNLWRGLRLYEELGDSIAIASCFLNIGNSYRELTIYDKSLEYYLKGLELYEATNYETGAAMAHGNIGFVYKANGDLDKALEYYHKSLSINDEDTHPEEARIDLHNIGLVYVERQEYDKALEYLEHSLRIARRLGSEHGMVATASEIARVRMESGAYEEAAVAFREVLEMARQRNFKTHVMDAYEDLSDTYAAMGRYRQALEYRKEYEVWKDSLLDNDNERLLLYLVKVGKELPRFGTAERSEDNAMKGCESKLWLTAEYRNNRLYYAADSDSAITKGLLSLVLRIYQGHPAEDILQSELFFIRHRKMSRFIGSAYSNGFATIDAVIKEKARTYSEQSECPDLF